MNAKTIKKIRKELNAKEKEVVNGVFDYFNSLPFVNRCKLAFRMLRGKL